MDKKILIAGAGVAAALLLGGTSPSQERYFTVNGVSVPESQLTSMGFTKVNGEWWPNSYVQQAAQQAGVGVPSGQQGTNQQGDAVWAVIGGVLATSMQLIPLFKDLSKGKK